MALTMEDMVGIIHRIDQNVQRLIDLLNPQSLTLADWQGICRENLAVQKQIRSNPFTRSQGMEAKLEDIYVPLAIVERKPSQRVPFHEQEQGEKLQEVLTPISEDAFFEEVLRRGNSKISRGRRIAIIGEPGSGKTTRLEAIAHWILRENLGIPIWIPLAEFTEPTLVDYLQGQWLKPAGVEGAIRSLQDQKEHLWLLMDGLDEMVARIERPHVNQLLKGWVQSGRVIITCRVNVWEADQNALSGFDVYRNLPFEVDQMEMFIRRFFAESG
ncbi:MAG: NACHT domain-containing protein [Spirulina sp. DLM2.Bin59]|nr:MAG: NACHT domain-containing protein [Spirulina sp. DLM2.Bin59]